MERDAFTKKKAEAIFSNQIKYYKYINKHSKNDIRKIDLLNLTFSLTGQSIKYADKVKNEWKYEWKLFSRDIGNRLLADRGRELQQNEYPKYTSKGWTVISIHINFSFIFRWMENGKFKISYIA